MQRAMMPRATTPRAAPPARAPTTRRAVARVRMATTTRTTRPMPLNRWSCCVVMHLPAPPNAQTQPRRQICASKFGDVGWSAMLGGIHGKLGHLTGRARLRLVVGSLELSHVELHHRHHGFHHNLHLPGVPISDQLGESSRDNLPGETEGVF